MVNERARALRKRMSESEHKLWRELRARQLDGVRFRRQHPIGPYIADFVCLEHRLVVEVDGAHHTDDAQIAHDERRDRWLAAEGYRVMRFSNTDVFENLGGVVDTIWGALQELPDARASRHPHQERHRT
jgi:very-short-patch-repair endonuclease